MYVNDLIHLTLSMCSINSYQHFGCAIQYLQNDKNIVGLQGMLKCNYDKIMVMILEELAVRKRSSNMVFKSLFVQHEVQSIQLLIGQLICQTFIQFLLHAISQNKEDERMTFRRISAWTLEKINLYSRASLESNRFNKQLLSISNRSGTVKGAKNKVRDFPFIEMLAKSNIEYIKSKQGIHLTLKSIKQ